MANAASMETEVVKGELSGEKLAKESLELRADSSRWGKVREVQLWSKVREGRNTHSAFVCSFQAHVK